MRKSITSLMQDNPVLSKPAAVVVAENIGVIHSVAGLVDTAEMVAVAGNEANISAVGADIDKVNVVAENMVTVVGLEGQMADVTATLASMTQLQGDTSQNAQDAADSANTALSHANTTGIAKTAADIYAANASGSASAAGISAGNASASADIASAKASEATNAADLVNGNIDAASLSASNAGISEGKALEYRLAAQDILADTLAAKDDAQSIMNETIASVVTQVTTELVNTQNLMNTLKPLS
jgi:hypothetical protein